MLLAKLVVIVPIKAPMLGNLGLGVELATARGHLDALGGRGHGSGLVPRLEVCDALVLELALLVAELLLLEVVDLCVDV